MAISAAKQFGSNYANPQSVLRHIGATPVDLSDQESGGQPASEPAPVDTTSAPLRLFKPDEFTSEAEQTRQLGLHLTKMREELLEQKATFDEERLHWILQCEQDHQALEDRAAVVENRERQVRSLEAQLLQLQNDVIDGQTGLRSVAEKLLTEGFADASDPEKIAALEDLRFEISERFDYVVKRWQRLRKSCA